MNDMDNTTDTITSAALHAVKQLADLMLEHARAHPDCAEGLAKARAMVESGKGRIEIAFAIGDQTAISLGAIDAEGRRVLIACIPVASRGDDSIH